jgi:branched-chain amino acid transport system substrate-binding protein
MKKVFLSVLIVLFLSGFFTLSGNPLLSITSAHAQKPISGVKYIVGTTPYRTGPFGIEGAAFANAVVDLIKLINKKGGLDGYQIQLVEIETGYETPRMVEAYERTKTMGTVLFFIPMSTGGVYAVTPKAFKDKIPLVHGGWGISAAAYGKAFPWNFLGGATYWSGDAASMKYIADKEGGEAMLKDKKIAIVYLDVDYGRETIPLHEALIKEFGYKLIKYPVPGPGLEQSAVWSDIALKTKPDYVFVRMWGMSNTTSLKEAVRVGYPMDRIFGCNWGPTTPTTLAAQPEKCVGVKKTVYSRLGTDIPIVKEILKELYDRGEGAGPREFVGTESYNNLLLLTGMGIAAAKLAANKFGHPLDSDKMKWGFEHITFEALKFTGVDQVAPPKLSITPDDHEGGGWVSLAQWDGKKFVNITDWLAPYRHVVNALVMEAAGKFMRENPGLYR